VQIKPFSELTSPDERTLRFGGFGLLLDGKLTPEDAAEFQQRAVAGAELSETVPEMVRDSYERLRELHSYGVLFYDAFTLTSELRWVTLEMALRERFIGYYSGSIPIIDRAGHTDTFVTSSFYELGKAFRKVRYARSRLEASPGCGKESGSGAAHLGAPIALGSRRGSARGTAEPLPRGAGISRPPQSLCTRDRILYRDA
jgi:hypothetical protein